MAWVEVVRMEPKATIPIPATCSGLTSLEPLTTAPHFTINLASLSHSYSNPYSTPLSSSTNSPPQASSRPNMRCRG